MVAPVFWPMICVSIGIEPYGKKVQPIKNENFATFLSEQDDRDKISRSKAGLRLVTKGMNENTHCDGNDLQDEIGLLLRTRGD